MTVNVKGKFVIDDTADLDKQNIGIEDGTGSLIWQDKDGTNHSTADIGGDVESVNGETGVVVLDTDDIADTATNRYTNDSDAIRLANTSGTNTGDQDLSDKQDILAEGAFQDGDKTKLDGIETGAEVNNISDTNADIVQENVKLLNEATALYPETYGLLGDSVMYGYPDGTTNDPAITLRSLMGNADINNYAISGSTTKIIAQKQLLACLGENYWDFDTSVWPTTTQNDNTITLSTADPQEGANSLRVTTVNDTFARATFAVTESETEYKVTFNARSDGSVQPTFFANVVGYLWEGAISTSWQSGSFTYTTATGADGELLKFMMKNGTSGNWIELDELKIEKLDKSGCVTGAVTTLVGINDTKDTGGQPNIPLSDSQTGINFIAEQVQRLSLPAYICSIPPWGATSNYNEAYNTPLNDWILAGSSDMDKVIDLTEMGDSNYELLPEYNLDNTHWNDAGAVKGASLMFKDAYLADPPAYTDRLTSDYLTKDNKVVRVEQGIITAIEDNPAVFTREFKSEALVKLEGGAITGTPVINDGITMTRSNPDYLTYVLNGELNNSEISIVWDFISGFSPGDGNEYALLDNSGGGGRNLTRIDSSGNMDFYMGATTRVLEVPYANYISNWNSMSRNVLIISSSSDGDNESFLNGVSIGTSATTWTVQNPSFSLLGAISGGVNTFSGTMLKHEIYQSKLTEQNAIDLYGKGYI